MAIIRNENNESVIAFSASEIGATAVEAVGGILRQIGGVNV
jgi:hypothetical protein